MDQPAAWDRLAQPYRTCLEQAWAAVGRRGLPVGAAVTRDGLVIGKGRNRVYDEPGGSDRLQETPLAHAEMNAVADVPPGAAPDECEIWSTQSPCSMCRAMIEFIGLGDVHYLATDPSDEDAAGGPWLTQGAATVWLVVANTLFLHNVAWIAGEGSATVSRSLGLEPEITTLALGILADETLIRLAGDGTDLPGALIAIWDDVDRADLGRLERIG